MPGQGHPQSSLFETYSHRVAAHRQEHNKITDWV